MITTIIFDIGNVLADFTWRQHFESFGYDEAMVDRIAKASILSDVWNEYDRGEMTDDEIFREFVRNDPEIEPELAKVFANVKTIISRNDYAIPWIQELKRKGYRLLYLSNFSEKAESECAYALDFIPYLDGGIMSYREKLIKPMPEIYRLLIERYHLTPEECVFMDDTAANLDAAAKFGIHTILFTDKEQAVRELRKLGVDA